MAEKGGHWVKSAGGGMSFVAAKAEKGGEPSVSGKGKSARGTKARMYTKWIPDGKGGEIGQEWGVYANGREVLLDTGKKQLAFANRVWGKMKGS